MAAEKAQVYKCNKCGIVFEILHAGGGHIVCCGEPAAALVENTVDAAREKHVPVVSEVDGKVQVTVGSVPHPMLEEHYIEWIEIVTPDLSVRRYLKPGEEPSATFCTLPEGAVVREYCNLHGLWKAE